MINPNKILLRTINAFMVTGLKKVWVPRTVDRHETPISFDARINLRYEQFAGKAE